MSALRRTAAVAGWVTAALSAYDAQLAVSGWRNPAPAPPSQPRRRLRVVVPAHDEAGVLAGVLQDLRRQTYPSSLVDVVVLADRCTDGTVELARSYGATADEREDGPPGKGHALRWHLERRPLADGDALVVLDADTRVPPDLLQRFHDELEQGADALQAYLDVSNPDGSLLATANALAYWSGNRMVQLARRNRGWSCDLGGTGMCLSQRALAVVGGMGTSFSEDRELTFRLELAGLRTRWLHAVRVLDEKPTDVAVAVRQRARWRTGLDDVRRRYLGRLAAHALQERSGSAADLALRLVRPSRGAVVVTAAAAVALNPPRRGSATGWLTAAGLAAQVLLPPVFLVRDGVAPRHLARYPAAVAYPLLALPIRVVAVTSRGRWFHTPHRGLPVGPAQEPTAPTSRSTR